MSNNEDNIAQQITLLLRDNILLFPSQYNIQRIIDTYNTSHNTNIILTDSLERLIVRYTFEDSIAQDIASKLVSSDLPLNENNILEVIQRFNILDKYRRYYSDAALNAGVRARIEPNFIKEKNKLIAPVKTMAVPSDSNVFQGPAVQATLIDTDDDGNIYATRVPGKKNTWHKRVTSMFGMTSKKPIATPVGGKRKTRKSKKTKKSRRYRKKRV
jgi:hypothetical protein